MKIKSFLFLLGIPVLCGCIGTAHLYPIRGPLSAQTPPPILLGKVSGIARSGNISVTLADGELCKGRWALVPRSPASPAANVAANSLSSEWDTVYGPGFYVAHVLGMRFLARAVLPGNRGTTLTVEMYKPDNAPTDASPSFIKGVAKDTKDNIYKLVF